VFPRLVYSSDRCLLRIFATLWERRTCTTVGHLSVLTSLEVDSGESKVIFRCKRPGVSPRHCARVHMFVTWTNRGCSMDMMHIAACTFRNYCRICQTHQSWEPVLRTRSSWRGTLVCVWRMSECRRGSKKVIPQGVWGAEVLTTDFSIIKPTKCTNFSNLLRHETLHVSGSSSAHRQDSLYTRHWYMSYRSEDSFRAGPGWNGPARKLSSNLCGIYQRRVYSE